MTFRILLTSVGGAMSPYTIQCFQTSKRHRVEVVGVDHNPDALGRHFAAIFEPVPAGDDPAYADCIGEIVRKHRVDLVLPCSDEEAASLAAARPRLEQAGVRIASPPPSAISIMTDKLETLRLLDRIGILAPEWTLASNKSELYAAIKDLRARHRDVAVKPVRSRGSRDVYVIERSRQGLHQPAGHRECYLDLDTFHTQIALSPTPDAPLLVMQGLRAPAHDTDVLCQNGKVLSAIPRRRINPAGIPFRGGEILDDAALLAIADKVAHALDASWLFDIDTMSDDAGKPRVIEINSRPSGSLSAAVAAGLPILDDLISMAKGETFAPAPLPHGRTVLPFTSIIAV